jgi:lipopolysaccharide transport system permease protein
MMSKAQWNLVFYKASVDLKAESERTYIGFLWWLVEPVISLIVYYIVFSLIFRSRTQDFLAFLFVGIASYSWMRVSVSHSAESILAGRNLMQQVYLTKLFFPTVSIISDTAKFLCVLLVVVIVLNIFGFHVTPAYAAIPPILLTELLFITALSYIVAAIVPFFPDLRVLLGHILHLMFFLSGVLYPVSKIPENVRHIFRLNPMVVIIESLRNALMHGKWPEWGSLTGVAACSVLGILIGVKLIQRYDTTYPKLT